VGRRYGLIGYPLAHSFSPGYCTELFVREGLPDYSYELFPVEAVEGLPEILHRNIKGLNVTVPHKTAIISWLNDLDRDAWQIGAVNTLVRTGSYSWKGYNTDMPAFVQSLCAWYGPDPLPDQALVLGTGGSARAIRAGLVALGIHPVMVSCSGKGDIGYADIQASLLAGATLLVQCTPLGMLPRTAESPPIPYDLIDDRHRLYDLVYNPGETLFLARGRARGARVKNGLDMLHRQADLAWTIWKSYAQLFT